MDNDRPVVLITGSTSGIGANIARDMLTMGCHVIITGRDQARLDIIVANSKNGESVHAFKADLMNLREIDRLLDFVKNKFGHLDILINNACFRGEKIDILNSPIEEFGIVYHMNVSAPMYIIHKSIKLLRRSNNDPIIVINISSIASQVVVPLQSYSITKCCISEMTKKLQFEKGLLCLTVSPGPVLTETRPGHVAMDTLTLMKRVGTPQEISDVVIHCIKNITKFNGQEIIVDGGYLAREHVTCCIRK